MPYLTSTATGTASTDVRLGFGIPGYAHPLVAPVEWAELARPGTPLHWVVLNVGGGPGVWPDPHCLEAVGRVRNTARAQARDAAQGGRRPAGAGRVLGHLDARYGARAFGELVSDAHRYLDWYQVDGFLIDHCPTERAALPEIRRTVAALRALLEEPHIVFGHGTHPYPGYAEVADQLVTFAGPWSDYRWSQVAEWTADHPPERFCHLVHGVPRGHLDEALRIARWQGASTIYFTDRTPRAGSADPWAGMPGYWDEIVSLLGPPVSE
ncbi:phage tail protein [Streptomyces sp. PSKA54]|uniref:Phage tail protein n=1 Tax=Streptomyces himalayensis subsp. aureolus TaxID=2758039 RepID=A0A7W2HJ30_9ACTN|nr:spherulation-specific family 4 protein [Streptomyces himalayensis]MBA4865681.1 phage tail protein [Streptomyces himalayensis subsp. aureolus]